jgi:hypothetical protein
VFARPAFGATPLPADAFGYDSAAPLQIAERSEAHRGNATIREISFASANGRRVRAEVISPNRVAGRHGAVLFVHWLGDPQTTNFTEFNRDALQLAAHGCVSLLIDAMWSRPHWYERYSSPETDYATSVDQVVDLRRSLDVLLRQPGVDRRRVAFVGHDFGAMYGAILSGVDTRPRWYVLMAGNPSLSQWFLFFPKLRVPRDRTAYLAQMSRLDPTLYMKRSRAEQFFFQFAFKDPYIPLDRAFAFVAASPLPHGMFVYNSPHSLAVPAAYRDRMDWLLARVAYSGNSPS